MCGDFVPIPEPLQPFRSSVFPLKADVLLPASSKQTYSLKVDQTSKSMKEKLMELSVGQWLAPNFEKNLA